MVTLESRSGRQRRVSICFGRVPAVAGFGLAAEAAVFVLLLQALLVHFLLELPPLILVLFRQLRKSSLLLYLVSDLCAHRAGCLSKIHYSIGTAGFRDASRHSSLFIILKVIILLIVEQAFLVDDVDVVLHALVLGQDLRRVPQRLDRQILLFL